MNKGTNKVNPGDEAPDFALQDQNGKTWKLSDLRGRRVILYFYPADHTPGCTAEACDFRDSSAELQQAGYVVLGVSPQDAESHRSFVSDYALNFPLLVDEDLSVAQRYGAVKEPPGEWEGIKLMINRSTFVIDEAGKVVEALYGVKAQGHVQRLKEKLEVASA